MAEKFTGFMEVFPNPFQEGEGNLVVTTIGPWYTDDLLAAIRKRLVEAPVGVTFRIDLIAWEE